MHQLVKTHHLGVESHAGCGRREIEALFKDAERDRSAVEGLKRKLREYGLLEEYEDRFLGLF